MRHQVASLRCVGPPARKEIGPGNPKGTEENYKEALKTYSHHRPIQKTQTIKQMLSEAQHCDYLEVAIVQQNWYH